MRLSDRQQFGNYLVTDLFPGWLRIEGEAGTEEAWRGGKSLAVELPGVEFGGAWQCPGGRNQSE